MKLLFHNKQDISLKVVFLFLLLLLSGILFVNGSIAFENCREYSETPALCDTCCNPENTQRHCHNQCSLPIDLPKVALVSNGSVHSDTFDLAAIQSKISGRIPEPELNPLFISNEKTYTSPPIFLQNESFLI
jgi:hypothetical protein